MFIVHFHAGRNATAVICHADGIVAMDGNDDVITMPSQRFINRIVNHLKHQVMQASTVGRVSDIHAGALAHGLKAFQNLNRALAVGF